MCTTLKKSVTTSDTVCNDAGQFKLQMSKQCHQSLANINSDYRQTNEQETLTHGQIFHLLLWLKVIQTLPTWFLDLIDFDDGINAIRHRSKDNGDK
jgi:hypothetical protein